MLPVAGGAAASAISLLPARASGFVRWMMVTRVALRDPWGCLGFSWLLACVRADDGAAPLRSAFGLCFCAPGLRRVPGVAGRVRRKLTMPQRRLEALTIERDGDHWGEPVRCRYAAQAAQQSSRHHFM